MTLAEKRCLPCEGGTKPLDLAEVQTLLQSLSAWQTDETAKKIYKKFSFKNYYHTMAFVNAVAWIAHQENHHPELMVSYNTCTVEFTTHSIDGLSHNDFICAAKVEKLIGNQ